MKHVIKTNNICVWHVLFCLFSGGGGYIITWYFPLIMLNFFVKVEGQSYYGEQTISSITWCKTGFWIRRFLKFRVQSLFSIFTEVPEVHRAALRRAGSHVRQLLQEQHRHIITRYYGDAEEMIHVHEVSRFCRVTVQSLRSEACLVCLKPVCTSVLTSRFGMVSVQQWAKLNIKLLYIFFKLPFL